MIRKSVLPACLVVSLFAEEARPEWFKDYPGLTAEITGKLYVEAPDPAFRARKMKASYMRKWVAAAGEKVLNEKLSDFPDSEYMDFFKTGSRELFQKAFFGLLSNLQRSTYLYLLTEDIRYVKQAEKDLEKLCSLKSWVLPAHDYDHKTFDGKERGNDLGSTNAARRIAIVIYTLRKQLSPALFEKTRKEIMDRVIIPVEDSFTKKEPYWWMVSATNWNAVCMANLIITGACVLENEPARRDRFVDNCLRLINYSLEAFKPDGYCSEGMGYWNYGVGHYLCAAWAVYILTDGKQNLLDLPKAKPQLLYPEKIMMTKDIVPTFADCHFTAKPEPALLKIVDFLTGKTQTTGLADTSHDLLYVTWDWGFLNENSKAKPEKKQKQKTEPEAVSQFKNAGVSILRPGKSSSRLHAAIKGGSNHELHNHNDVGSYVILCDGVPVLCDPGSEVYTARTFSKDRYQSRILGSFGHPVPLIAGQEQFAGSNTDAKLLEEKITDELFFWKMEIRKAYAVKDLKSMIREFTYQWKGNGSVIIKDTMTAAKPLAFETALVTPGTFKKVDEKTILTTCKKKTLRIRIDTAGIPFTLNKTTLTETKLYGKHPVRLGIKLEKTVANALISLEITPQ